MTAEARKQIVGLIEALHEAIDEIRRREQAAVDLPADLRGDVRVLAGEMSCVAADLFIRVRENEAALV